MKHDETMAKNQINLLSLRSWTSGEILRRRWQMVMKMVIIPCLLALFHKSECKSKSRQNRPLVCFRTVTEESKLKNRRSWVLLDRSSAHVARKTSGTVRLSDHHFYSPIMSRRGGGVATEKGTGRFSGPRDNAGSTGPNHPWGFPKLYFELVAMNNQQSIFDNTVVIQCNHILRKNIKEMKQLQNILFTKNAEYSYSKLRFSFTD